MAVMLTVYLLTQQKVDTAGSASSKVSGDSGLSESVEDGGTLRRGVQVSIMRGYSEDKADVNSTSSADTITDDKLQVACKLADQR